MKLDITRHSLSHREEEFKKLVGMLDADVLLADRAGIFNLIPKHPGFDLLVFLKAMSDFFRANVTANVTANSKYMTQFDLHEVTIEILP